MSTRERRAKQVPGIDAGALRQRIAELESQLAVADRPSELVLNEGTLRAVVDCLPFDVFLIGADGRYVLQNTACLENWGNVVGKRPGLNVLRLDPALTIDPEDIEGFLMTLESLVT